MMHLKSPEEIKVMAEGGRRLARILRALMHEVKAGVATKTLDARARELVAQEGGTPAFLGYRPPGAARPYPAAICVSINEVVVHGIPSDSIVKDGDLVTIDMGLLYEGFYTDSARTVGVGNVTRENKKLMKVAERALKKGIAAAREGNALGDIGHAIAQEVKKGKFSVVQSLTGHGIGRALHEAPTVLNFGNPGEGETLKAGMVVAIEPMIAMGSGKVKCLKDESFATSDGSPSAHFEHTVAITERGPRILTQ